jgi:hypothetical protein
MKAEAEGRTGAENAARIRSALDNLRGRIPELKELHVGTNVLPSSTEPAELALVTRHDDAAGLAAYAAHPDHQKVLAILKETTSTRRAIDFMD